MLEVKVRNPKDILVMTKYRLIDDTSYLIELIKGVDLIRESYNIRVLGQPYFLIIDDPTLLKALSDLLRSLFYKLVVRVNSREHQQEASVVCKKDMTVLTHLLKI